ncbi:phosphatidylglycerophosphate synthase [Rhizobium sp. PP-F2F-G20b]|nr:phosphatidylglycerophosphate synthase [Rhizobium sp. PP-F2F-G20b]
MATIDDGRTNAAATSAQKGAAASAERLANTAKALAVVYSISALMFGLAASKLPLEPSIPLIAGAVLAVIFALVIRGLPFHPHPRFGYANLVTALRAGLISLVCAVVLFSDAFGREKVDVLIWATAATVFLALLLDGVDGYLARRFHQQSAFGARFDMELDAFLILILSVAALVLNKAGAWVLLIGLLRYVFVVAQQFFPWMENALPESFRRKMICVFQIAALCGVMLPFVTEPVSELACGAALALLIYSFSADIRYLMATRGERA